MGFFSKLKKVVAGVDKGAAIASGVLPGKAGQVAGEVAQSAGVVTSVVQQIQSKAGSELPPEEAQKQATLATAVAIDDHEERMKALEAAIQALHSGSSGQTAQSGSSAQSGQTGGAGQSNQSSQTGDAGTSSQSGQSTHTGDAGTSTQSRSK